MAPCATRLQSPAWCASGLSLHLRRARPGRTRAAPPRATRPCAPRATVEPGTALLAQAGSKELETTEALPRRGMLLMVGAAGVGGLTGADEATAFGTLRLSERVVKRELKNKVFNVPPSEMCYPSWLEGTWDVTTTFAGYKFPSRVPKERVIANANVPGFQKLSLVYLPDVGKTPVSYQLRYSRRPSDGKVVEDRAFNITSVVSSYLGDIVTGVEYSGSEPNRTTVNFKKNATRNAERIELFTNSRETDTREENGAFYAAECMRQVTLGYSNEYGVARMLVCDYQNAWTFIPVPGDPNSIQAELLTAGYLQSSEPDYFDALTDPVVLFSHSMKLTRTA